MQLTLAHVNKAGWAEFMQLIGPVFEASPWIAEATWPRRPFATLADLHAALCATVRATPESRQLELLCAHPDLAGRAALAGKLTRESAQEQAGAGLTQLTAAELALFQERNAAYRARFGFPFIICARLNAKEAILAALARRQEHSREEEIRTALEEIFKIAHLRLRDLIQA